MITAYAPMPTQRLIAREGYPFLFIAIGIALVFFALGWLIPALAATCATAFIAFFFRNPERAIPSERGLILAPADGRVITVEQVERAPHIDCPATKISIFMSVFNVHINRMPVSAAVREVIYRPGAFFVASLDKACEHNERNTLVLEADRERRVVMTQIAGLVARRIVCYLKKDDTRRSGDRMGLIRFGSRVDLYITDLQAVDVKVGDRVKGGSSILGRWS